MPEQNRCWLKKGTQHKPDSFSQPQHPQLSRFHRSQTRGGSPTRTITRPPPQSRDLLPQQNVSNLVTRPPTKLPRRLCSKPSPAHGRSHDPDLIAKVKFCPMLHPPTPAQQRPPTVATGQGGEDCGSRSRPVGAPRGRPASPGARAGWCATADGARARGSRARAGTLGRTGDSLGHAGSLSLTQFRAVQSARDFSMNR